ncbi:unnamed protein product [Cyprideis torosa]|uniref:Uncharacterized protein n=1 Tax=Cyprideis torosa TaxID=163714 RepID=A0A7R8ZVS9_9CRUS|nr:unnamed protein product [Cyprideis torosa]CAG0903530.1 unnamed protein product [Cyprideis torosa]
MTVMAANVMDDGGNLEQVRDAMFQSLVQTEAYFKNQQRGEPDLTTNEKLVILAEVYSKGPAAFLGRFGSFLRQEDLVLFDNIDPDDYEASFHLEEIRRRLQIAPSADAAKVRSKRLARETATRNRRYAALQELASSSSYFTEAEMRKREPVLFDQMIGRSKTFSFSTNSTACLRCQQINPDSSVSPGAGGAEIPLPPERLLGISAAGAFVIDCSVPEDRLSSSVPVEVEFCLTAVRSVSVVRWFGSVGVGGEVVWFGRCRWYLSEEERSEMARESASQEERLSSILIEHEFNLERTAAVEAARRAEEEEEVEEEDEDELPPDEGPSEEEKQRLRLEFRDAMMEMFIGGQDSEFDYSSVDENPMYDDLEEIARAQEEYYFDSEEPS